MTATPKRLVAVVCVAAAAGLAPRGASAADRYWSNGAGGAFGSPANWGGSPPPAVSDAAIFHLGSEGYVVDFATSRTSRQLLVWYDSVTLDLNGRTWTLVGSRSVVVGEGDGDAAELVVSDGMLAGATLRIADDYGAVGTVAVVDGGAIDVGGQVQVGASGDGALEIVEGTGVSCDSANVGVSWGSIGYLSVGDPLSHLDCGDWLQVGDVGEAYVTAYGGGEIDVAGNATVARDVESNGFLTVEGAGSRMDVQGDLVVARDGWGTVDVLDGGRVSCRAATLGENYSSRGVVNVTGGSRWELSEPLLIAAAGEALLTVTEGGQVTGATMAVLGGFTDGYGLAKVTGLDSRLSVNGDLRVGESAGAAGALRVADGGAVACQTAAIGWAAGSWGDAVVDGAEADLSCQSELNVGDLGEGSLTVVDGARAQCDGTAHIGRGAGSLGTAVVAGPGSSWQMGDLRCGDAGDGSLVVANGGCARFNWGTIGSAVDANGSLTVAEPGSCAEANERIAVGWQGRGTIAVVDGGLLRCTDLDVAVNATAVGWVEAAGEGSRIELSGGIYLGSGEGHLAVSDGAVVDAPREVQVQAGSEIALADGTVVTDEILLDGGTLRGWGRADAWLHGTGPIVAAGGELVVGNDTGPLLSVNGPVDVEDNATLEVVGGGSVSLDGTTRLTNGVLVVHNGASLAALEGYGVVVGDVLAGAWDIESPAGRVSLEVPLHVGGSSATVYTSGPADLGPETTMDGGYLAVADPTLAATLRLGAGDVLRGWGDVDAHVELANAIVDAIGGTIAISNLAGSRRLSGYGVVVGDVWADRFDIVEPTGTVELDGELHVGDAWATFYSAEAARLGETTTLEGGTIESPAGLALPADSMLIGYGQVEAPFHAEPGSLVVATGDLTLGDWGFSSLEGVWIEGLLEAGDHTVTLASFDPAYLDGVTILGGGTLAALNSIEMGDLSELHGVGTVQGRLRLVNGLIHAAADGRLDITGTLSGHGVVIGDVTAGRLRIAEEPDGQAYVPGEEGFDLSVGAQAGAIYSSDVAVLGCRVTLAGGTLVCEAGIEFAPDPEELPAQDGDWPVLEGFGTVDAAIFGQVDIAAAGGRLTVGDAARDDGVELTGGRIRVDFDATLELLDADEAQLGVEEVEIAGGVLIARTGAALDPFTLLWGAGVIVGDVSGGLPAIRQPSWPVRLAMPLDVGGATAAVYSAGEATLADTHLAGGELVAADGVRFEGSRLSGHGTVLADVTLAGGVVAADAGRRIEVLGDLAGCGVVVGDVLAGGWSITDPDGTVDLPGALDVGSLRATVYSEGPARLGRTTLAGGLLEAEGGLHLRGGERLSGHGTVFARLYGEPGSRIVAVGGELHVGRDDRAAAFVTDGSVEVHDAVLHIHSMTPGDLGPATRLDGGSVLAPNGLALDAGETLTGHGAVGAPFAAATGSTIEADGDLSLGADALDGFHSDGVLGAGGHRVELRDRNQAVLGALTTVGGGTLAAPNGMLLAGGRNLAGRGDVEGDFENQGYVLGAEGGLTFHDEVTGSGEFDGNVIFAGAYSPGDSPAVVHFGGSVTFTATATLVMELAENDNSDARRPRYDSLSVAGDVRAGGVLSLSWLPRAGEPDSRFGGAYDLIVYGGGHGGAFAIGGELAGYLASMTSTADAGDGSQAVRIELHALLDGDADLDADVDRADFLALRGRFGSAAAVWPDGDFTLDGAVDYRDYLALKRNAGAVVPAGGPVPEPATLWLLAPALALLRTRGRKARRRGRR